MTKAYSMDLRERQRQFSLIKLFEQSGSYSVSCWYGPIPMAPRIQFFGVA